MTERHSKLLQTLIELHIASAEPVASSVLAERMDEAVSSATIRNDLVVLEDEGYIMQPHTSAGRVPTAKGFLWYSEAHQVGPLKASVQKPLVSALEKGEDAEQALKNMAKVIAAATHNACFIGFEPQQTYYTGLSELFAQPEFQTNEPVVSLSRVIDHLDRIIYTLYETVDEPIVQIGDQCAFGLTCSAVMTRTRFRGTNALVAIVGPVRMSYGMNRNLISFIHSLS